MLSDQLGPNIKNLIGNADPTRADYGFGLGLALRTTPGVVRMMGSVGQFSWPGASGTDWWVDPTEELAVVYLSAAPGPLRWHYRQKINALVYQAIMESRAADRRSVNLNACSEFSSAPPGTLLPVRCSIFLTPEENIMKKFGYIVAAIVAVGLAAPSIASAETVVIKHGDRDRGARAEYREHREHRDHGWRHHGDRVVIIKHRHHHEY
jgi:hypothetical protein